MSEMPPYPSDPYGTQPAGPVYGPPQPYQAPQPYQPPVPYGYQPMPMYVQTPPTSGLATASLVLGILGLFGGWCTFGLPCFGAVLLGHAALKETRTGQKGGHGMAVAGLILGYILAIPMGILAVVFFASNASSGG